VTDGYGYGGISTMRDENAQDNGIGPIEVSTLILVVSNARTTFRLSKAI
jgi:hypothetical protein